MNKLVYEAVEIGDELPPHVCGPVSRTTLALYAGASGDHNPIHIDSDYAKNAGANDVFAHGMLSMAYLAQLLTNWVDQRQLREYGVRFTAITPVRATVTCRAKIIEKGIIAGEPSLKLELSSTIDDGTVTLIGDAVIGFS